MSEHPNALQLDAFAVGASHADAEHIRGCAQCQSFVAQSQVLPPPMPARIAGARKPRRLWWAGAAAMVLGTLAVFVLQDDTREKGTSTVAVYIKRGEEVTLWDGVKPVQAGDSLRLELPSTRFERVRVTSGERVLYDGPTHKRLPVSFRVDDEGHEERLRVLMSRQGEEQAQDVVLPKVRK